MHKPSSAYYFTTLWYSLHFLSFDKDNGSCTSKCCIKPKIMIVYVGYYHMIIHLEFSNIIFVLSQYLSLSLCSALDESLLEEAIKLYTDACAIPMIPCLWYLLPLMFT